MTTATAQEDLLIDYALATLSFEHFLPFVRIEESGSGAIPLEMWPHIQEMIDDLKNERLINWAKPRQISATTMLSIFALWHAQFIPNGWVLDISKGQTESREFLEKSRQVWENLPSPLQIPIEKSNLDQIVFVNGGKIDALPSTSDAGRGKNPTVAIFDEADFHEYLDSAINSVKPGLDDRAGKIIMSSTWNPYKTASLFQRTYTNPNNGYKKRFWPFSVRPGRTEEWYEERKSEAEDKALFEKEFPRNEEEMMAPANAVAFFDQPTLRSMSNDCREPVETILVGNGVTANIYQKVVTGKRYTAATDTSHGTGNDYAVTVVLDVVTGYVVADIYSSVIDATELGTASVELLRDYYESPIWAIEDNDWGVLCLKAAHEMKYKRIYYRDEDGEKPGWHTWDNAHASDGSRFVMLGDLARAIKSRLLTIPNREGLAQFMTMIRNPKKAGKVEAQEGGHDDYPMALGIAWQIKDQARPAGGIRLNNDQKDNEFRRRPRRSGRYSWGRS